MSALRPLVWLIAWLIGVAGLLAAQTPNKPLADPLHLAFERLYNVDFAGAHQVLDGAIRSDPHAPLPHSIKGAAYLFSELSRLNILEVDFFLDDDRLVDRRKLTADLQLRKAFFEAVETSERLANARLAAKADDREAMFAMCMASGVVMDYAALIERRRLGSFPLAKRTHGWARRLLTLEPPLYDAYMTYGTIEYVLGSMPFFVRWFIRFDQIKGSRQEGIRQLELVAQHGKYYGPLARTMLAVIHTREKRPAAAEKLLAELAAEYPENPLYVSELARARTRLGR